jgi:hypothetical protein
MKKLKNFNEFLNEELHILKGPSDEETDEVFNSMTPDQAILWSVKHKLPDYTKKAIQRGADIIKYLDLLNKNEITIELDDETKTILKSKFDNLSDINNKLLCAFFIDSEEYYLKALSSFLKNDKIFSQTFKQLIKYACEKDFDTVLDYLIDNFIEKNYFFSVEVLESLFKFKKYSIIERLINNDFENDDKENGNKILTCATKFNNLDVVKYMVEKGYKLDFFTGDGTLRNVATRFSAWDVYKYLKDK